MKIRVIGARRGGQFRERTVTPVEFWEAWGPFAEYLWENARGRLLVVDGQFIIGLKVIP